MHVSKFSKAVLVGRINHLQQRLEGMRNLYERCCIGKPPSVAGGSPSIPVEAGVSLHAQTEDLVKELAQLKQEIEAEVKEELGELLYYNQRVVETTFRTTGDRVRQRFGHFPMASAVIEMFTMLLESDLRFNASMLNLRDKCAVEDRLNNSSSYGVDGEPNKKGRNECDHCPHVV